MDCALTLCLGVECKSAPGVFFVVVKKRNIIEIFAMLRHDGLDFKASLWLTGPDY